MVFITMLHTLPAELPLLFIKKKKALENTNNNFFEIQNLSFKKANKKRLARKLVNPKHDTTESKCLL